MTLTTGDYTIEGAEDACIVERKKDLFEVYGNVISKTGRRRFVAELDRLNGECAYPVLLFEGAPTYLTGSKEVKHRSGLTPNDLIAARDELLGLMFAHRIHYAILPAKTTSQRAAVGEWLVATLAVGARYGSYDSSKDNPRSPVAGSDFGGTRFPLLPAEQ